MLLHDTHKLPRSKRTSRIRQESSGNRWDLETVFRTEKSSDFSGVFQPNSCSLWWKTAGSYWKNPKIFGLGILLSIPINFRAFSVGNGDFLLCFRPVPVVSGGRSLRPGSLPQSVLCFLRSYNYSISKAISV